LTSTEERVVLVDEQDQPLGEMEKLEAHRQGVLHRAISVFVFNGSGELLLQRRAAHKYHSAGLWTNTCCSHPRPGESVAEAAERRLMEEMGMDCPLTAQFSFVYRAEFEDGLIEHELDHVLTGHSDAEPTMNPDEVAEWRYASIEAVRDEMAAFPERFTPWFRICFERAVAAG
jgi:isopentenyl-diphosphate delta-isomerase